MPQLHCYVPEEVADALRRRAEAENTSLSAYLGSLVRRELGADSWPEGFFDRVAGGWVGEPLERLPQPVQAEREVL